MLTGETQKLGTGAPNSNDRGELDLGYDVEIEALENELIESEIADLQPASIKNQIGEKVAGALKLSEELSEPTRQMLSAVSDYIFNELRVRDPDDVVAAIIKLADMANLKTAQPEGMLAGIAGLIETQRKFRGLQARNEHRANQGYFA